LIELFLKEMLGIPWDRVHTKAHRLEHAISDYLPQQLVVALKKPESDPHGHLIPDRNGKVAHRRVRRLSTINPGSSVVIGSVDDEDATLFRFLGDFGLVPDTRVCGLEPEPFGGSVDHTRNGFDPIEYLVDWNCGRVGYLPNGRRLRDYDFTAVDREIEIAP
jgi:DtxR family Mn-dependent transcriptional regulator